CKNKEAINKMDKFENTPIKLAAVGNLKESFEMLSQYTRSEADMFSAHLIHNVDIEVLKISLHSWKKREPEAVMRLLSGDHQHQPFLEAARKGNIDLMEFFLQKGANPLQRTPDDQTAIHYAVLSGKLEAVKHLLNKKEFLEMIDFTDEVNITAAGYAAQTGFADILRCLLENYNAQMKSDKKTARLNILDSAYGYFKTGEPSIKEIIKFCTKNNKIDILQELFEDSHFGADCIMSKLIEETPDVAMLIFNLCVYKDEYFTHRSYGETELRRRVSYSFFPFMRKHRKCYHA
ncbi:serine threonine- phosphatase 6 regulatory ankyrin repeat subunit B, partial [Paramuricea clavata]